MTAEEFKAWQEKDINRHLDNGVELLSMTLFNLAQDCQKAGFNPPTVPIDRVSAVLNQMRMTRIYQRAFLMDSIPDGDKNGEMQFTSITDLTDKRRQEIADMGDATWAQVEKIQKGMK